MAEPRDALATEMDMLVKGLKIVTRCRTEDELVAAFWKFCTPTTCFIPTKDHRRIGIESLFSLRLADNTVAVRGLCIVREVWPHGDNAFHRPGIQVEILRISDDTKHVYARMLARRADKTPQLGDTARIDSRAEMPTIEMPPVLPDDVANDCALGEEPDRARTDVEPDPFAPIEDTSVDHAAPRSVPTLLGMAPPDQAAPRYVSEEPRASKLLSPIRPSLWNRFAAAVDAALHWRPRRARGVRN